MYVLEKGVPKDYVRAHLYFNLAAAQGYKNSAEVRDLTAKKMTPADISRAQRLARDWTAAFEKRKKN